MSRALADDLVREFEDVCGLSAYDAKRSAFLALAHHQGWSGARIGRYLGTSRARVDQRLQWFRIYAGLPLKGDPEAIRRYIGGSRRRELSDLPVPTLKEMLETALPRRMGDTSVGFSQEDWEDPEFSDGMLDMIVSEMDGAVR